MQLHDRTRIREAWTAFWQDPASGQQCIRGAPDVTHALRGHWSSFAAQLGAGARILDLGCGAGAAAAAMMAARRDLQVTGVDFAIVPAAADASIRLFRTHRWSNCRSKTAVSMPPSASSVTNMAAYTRPRGSSPVC